MASSARPDAIPLKKLHVHTSYAATGKPQSLRFVQEMQDPDFWG